MHTDIPTHRPATPLLDRIQSPADLKPLSFAELNTLADELRIYLLYCVGQTGGHFSAGLGVVELTIALHHVLNLPDNDLIWDVGHQAYPHKILTGRRDSILNMRALNGLAPFPKREESRFDSFGVGHSSTSISAALGMAIAKEDNNQSSHTVAVIGDGAMTAGMAFEALNHAVHCKQRLLIILNDNTMSISENVGGLAKHLESIWQKKTGTRQNAPSVNTANLFEDIGIDYTGPIDGHDIKTVSQNIKRLLNENGPCLLHVQTTKGKGFSPAISDPIAYHALTKIEKVPSASQPSAQNKQRKKYQDIFSEWLCETAKHDPNTMAITPAMREGSGLLQFSQDYPARFFDVAIAEQHAVTFAAGLACKNKKPVVAIYSTFLQRAYDQIIHDVAIQNLNVLFAIDRAGIVGEDGATHNGSFDIAMLRCLPNFIVATPSNQQECVKLLDTAYQYQGPAAVRYPRGYALSKESEKEFQKESSALDIGKAHLIKHGKHGCILNFGALLEQSEEVAAKMNLGLVDMRWAEPLDTPLLSTLIESYDYFISIEDGIIRGGAGSAVLEYFHSQHKVKPLLQLGHPNHFIEHGPRNEVLRTLALDSKGIEEKIQKWLTKR